MERECMTVVEAGRRLGLGHFSRRMLIWVARFAAVGLLAFELYWLLDGASTSPGLVVTVRFVIETVVKIIEWQELESR